jgi:exopolysaccharide biosynthesis polyprenyl glycosylphosphotransferase
VVTATDLIDRSTAWSEGLRVYDDLLGIIDDRTQAILERRRKTAVVRRRGWLVRRMLLAADIVGLIGAFVAARLFFGPPLQYERVGAGIELLVFVATLPGWIVLAKLYDLYEHDEERADHSTVDDAVGVFHLVTIGTWLVFAFDSVTHLASPSLSRLLAFWCFATSFVTVARALARSLARRRITYLQNTVIVGADETGERIARKFRQHPEYGINLIGFVDGSPQEAMTSLGGTIVLGPPERLPTIVRLFDVERVVIGFSKNPPEDTLALVRSLKDLDVQVDIVPRLFEVVGTRAGLHTVEGIPLVGLPPLRLSRSTRLLKRTMDIALAAAALAALAPLIVTIAIWIKLDSRGPVFFRQIRRGSSERTFRIFKFRTMVADADQRKHEVEHLNIHRDDDPRMFKVPNDPRVTRVGTKLRRYSLDELPQLINVLKGDMSLVGPRPLILDEDRYVTQWARKRLDLKPGITGLWQVLGRSDIPFEEMVKLDYLYVTNWSLWGDLRLIVRTIPALLRPRHAY